MLKTTKTKCGNIRINLTVDQFKIIHSTMKQYEFDSFDYPEAAKIYKVLDRFRLAHNIKEETE